MDVLYAVRRFIERHDLIPRGTAVAAAVSGGSDSVTLAHALHRLAAAGDLRFAGIAHFNHQLRDTSNDDERLCERLAAALGVRVIAGRRDVRDPATVDPPAVRACARPARYLIFLPAPD